MSSPTEILGIFSDTLGNNFEIENLLYDGSNLNVKLLKSDKQFNLAFSNISLFMDTNIFDIWMYWDEFKDAIERSFIFEVPDSKLKNYLLLGHPYPNATTQGARVFCILSNERILLMLFRMKPEFKLLPIC